CNLDPNTLYTCTAAGATPSGGTVCDFGCQINVGDDTCKPDCTCPDRKDTCGSVFDPGCNLDPDTLYACSAVGATPVLDEVCAVGCIVKPTAPDSCKCKEEDDSVTAMIDTITAEMQALQSSLAISAAPDPITGIANQTYVAASNLAAATFPTIINALNQAKTDLESATTVQQIDLVVGTFRKTVTGITNMLVTLQSQLPADGQPLIQPVITDLNTLSTLLTTEATCTGLGQGDCTGITAVYQSLQAPLLAALNAAAATNPTVVNPVIQQVTDAGTAIDTALSTSTTTTLANAVNLLNQAIGAVETNPGAFPGVLAALQAYYEAASEALECAGLDTTPFTDRCAAVNAQLQGAMANIIQWAGGILNNVPVIGPAVSTPILDALTQAAVAAQTGGAAAIGTLIGTITGVVQIFGIVPEADPTGTSTTNAILNFLGIMQASNCGTPTCDGLLNILEILLQTLVNNVLAAFPLPVDPINIAANTLLSTLTTALNVGSSAALQAAMVPIQAAVGTISAAMPALAGPLNTLVNGINDLINCLITAGL
ncbi:hypothetical protein FBU30_008992, partial [Linnemannia zychae]